MSYVDTGDDELDYGEGELGDVAAAGVSLGAPADDDEMAQEDEYDDLYDDVNIGFFEAPPVGTLDGYGAGALDQNPDVKPNIEVADLDTRAMERTRLDPPLNPLVGKPSEAPAEAPKGLKIEPKEEFNDDKVTPARQDITNRNFGQQKESVSVPSSATDIGQVRQLQFFLLPSAKEQGSGYNNGVRQGASHVKTSPAAPMYGDGERMSGSVAVPHSGRHPGSGFSVGPGRASGENFKEQGDVEDVSYDRTSGPTLGAPRTAQRELPPNMADRQLVGSESAPRPMIQQSYSGDGNGMVFVGDLQWWTTDAELEAALSEYGRVKNLKFYEERVSGKSKGYCQVEFFDHASAVACKQGMNGRKFHDRPCIVALGNSKSIQQMGYQQEKKTQAQFQAQQEQMTNRRSNNSSSGGARGGPSYQDRDSSRGYGRTGTGRVGHAQGMGNKTGQGSGRGRGNYMNKGMGGGGGGSGGSGMPYGQGHSGPMGGHQSAMMMHQGMMGQGYDPAYGPMGRGGAGYGGFVMPGPPFPGMVTPFPSLGPGGLPGVAPHVNPAFFGRPNGMGMMPGGSMEGPHQGMWGDASLGGWGGEEHDRRARDGSYGEDGGGMDYSYNSDIGYEKSRTSGGWDKENGGLPERYRRDDRDGEWERDVYKERDRDAYRDRDRIRDRDEDWDRERTAKSRNKSRIAEEEDDPRLRSREDDYGRKRRIPDRELSNM